MYLILAKEVIWYAVNLTHTQTNIYIIYIHIYGYINTYRYRTRKFFGQALTAFK